MRVKDGLSSRDMVIQAQSTGHQVTTSHVLTKNLYRVVEFFIYLILILIFITPFIWVLFGSVRNEVEIFQYLYPFGWHTLMPVEWTLKNYLDIFGLTEEGKSNGLYFQRFLFNSFIVSAAVVICSLIFNTMGAYFFARLDFPEKYKNLLLFFVTFTLFVPFETTMVPLYIVVTALNIQDSFWGLILPWFASPFVIFGLMQYMHDIPKDLDEAAIIDGASYWSVLWRVIVPLSIPGIVTMALLEFQFIWNLFYWPLIVISKPELQMIQVAIANQTGQSQVFWGRTFAGAVLASLPVILLFLALQKYYVQGVATSGLKG
jgi:multiple sugar transport system permease protein/putative chitobiose transport system permease protein